MRIATLIIVLAATLAAAATAAAPPCDGPRPPVGARVTGDVPRVTSGDTFRLALATGTIAVRLADFAACRNEATRLNLVKIIGGKRLSCTVTGRERHAVRALCTVEGHSVARVLRAAQTCERP
jgi:endonuclease YncB( thermonuclease family)